MKKLSNISKCRGCKKELGETILDRLELDFFPKVDHLKVDSSTKLDKELESMLFS